MRHFILVFCAYTFILWHQLTGGLRRRWTNKCLNTFRTAISFRFFVRVACALHIWLTINRDVFAAYKASLGFISCSFEDLLLRPQGGRELSSRGKEDFPIFAQIPQIVTNLPNMISFGLNFCLIPILYEDAPYEPPCSPPLVRLRCTHKSNYPP
jgi:hypothetical protein